MKSPPTSAEINKMWSFIYMYIYTGVRGSVVVKALCYKSGGRGFDA
jgi:hypothetical protein